MARDAGSWRSHSQPIIAKIIAENSEKSDEEVHKLLMAAYPYGRRKHYPYKVWCDEVKKQMESRRTKARSQASQQKEMFG